MAENESQSAASPRLAAPPSVADVIVSSAVEALGSAFLLWLLGGVALSIAGSFAGNMVPSPPPGFAGTDAHEGGHSGRHHGWSDSLETDAFVLFFAIFFAHSLWAGFHRRGKLVGGRIGRILANLRENWFGLIIGNAIGAWVAALVLGCVPNFSFMAIFWHWLLGVILDSVREIAHSVFGSSLSFNLGAWLDWYDANQNKMAFWLIYLGGALDDLGVPNYKTLGRWAWRRWRKRKPMAAPVPATPKDA